CREWHTCVAGPFGRNLRADTVRDGGRAPWVHPLIQRHAAFAGTRTRTDRGRAGIAVGELLAYRRRHSCRSVDAAAGFARSGPADPHYRRDAAGRRKTRQFYALR